MLGSLKALKEAGETRVLRWSRKGGGVAGEAGPYHTRSSGPWGRGEATAGLLPQAFSVLLWLPVGQPGLWDTLFSSILLPEVGLLSRLPKERRLSILVCLAANLPTVRVVLNTQLSVGSALNELFITHFMLP